MFDIDSKEYWAIVAKDEWGDLWVMKQSQDCKDDDILEYGGSSLSDNNVSTSWADGYPVGVYKIELQPVMNSNDDIEEINVVSNHQLYEVVV